MTSYSLVSTGGCEASSVRDDGGVLTVVRETDPQRLLLASREACLPSQRGTTCGHFVERGGL